MIVMKFGGTSVGSAERIRSVAGLVRDRRDRRPVVVVSALGGVTDLLIRGARLALERDPAWEAAVYEALSCHHATVTTLFRGRSQDPLLAHVDALVTELRSLYTGVFNLEELTPRTLDAIAGIGERISCEIVAAALEDAGTPARAVDARRVVVTDESFGRAQPLMEETGIQVRATVRPLAEGGTVPVVSGFIGATRKGVATTLGRGGSDFTASVLGALLPAEEIQIWTDVDGMMTVDPRLVPGAKVIPEVSFGEAAELAYFGAKVLHPATIKPAVERDIPVRILNTLNPSAPGTRVTARPGEDVAEPRAIAFKKGITVVLISQPRMLMAYGFVARVFEVFDRHRTPVDLIATSEVSISLTVDAADALPAMQEELGRLGEVQVLRRMAIVSVVGRGFLRRAGLAARIFQSLREVNVVMISFGASDVNLSLVVAEDEAEKAVRMLHREFFEGGRG
ncbi:MAG: lysine-sensitive aspartokinase 3 [Acidobacteria bacterium]|nr:MAG: lysine-sensitive aspartokinase 3 [Acidobacteriota bacterium]